jgi:glucosamine kinase
MTSQTLGLGLDAGGTSTRWALADTSGTIVQEGSTGTLSGLMLSSPEGRAQFRQVLMDLGESMANKPQRVVMGLTGAGAGSSSELCTDYATQAFALPHSAIALRSDMALVHQAHFQPGAGHVLYAGTGSYASFLAADGQLHRVGGRGALLDDAGGGFWIGCEALRQVWRDEEDGIKPERGEMARAVFAQIGSDAWTATRALVYHQSLANTRGGIAQLTRAVAQVAGVDADAQALLSRAGTELARLGAASLRRFGGHEVVLAGRVLQEIPAVQTACKQALQAAFSQFSKLELKISTSDLNLSHAAARLAAANALPPIHEPE